MHDLNSDILICTINILVFLSILILIFSFYNTRKMNDIFKKDNISKIQGIPTPMMIIDIASNNVSSINQAMLNLLEMDTMTFNDLSHLNIFENFENYIELKNEIKSNPLTHIKNINIITSKGKKLVVEARYNYFEIGCKKYMTLVFNDKTNFFHYIRSLGVFSSVLDESPDGIIITQYNGFNESPLILYTNKAITELTGYEQSELLGKPVNVLFSLNVDDKTLKYIEKNLYALQSASIEYQYVQKNGEVSWVVSDIIPLNSVDINKSLNMINKINSINNENDNLFELLLNTNELYITIHQQNKTDEKKLQNTSKTFIAKLKSEVEEKNKYCNVLSKSLQTLLTINSKTEAIETMLKEISIFLDTERACVFNVYEKDDGTYFDLAYEWIKDKYKKGMIDEKLHDYSFSNIGGYELYTNLISNRLFIYDENSTKDLPLYEMINKYNIKSMVVAPIFHHGKLIAFLNFSDCEINNRTWLPETEKLLKEMSMVLGCYLTNKK